MEELAPGIGQDGICDDVDECVGTLDACGICNGPGMRGVGGNIPAGDCGCGGNQLDALGVCGGACAQDLDQDGICDDVDECVGTLDASICSSREMYSAFAPTSWLAIALQRQPATPLACGGACARTLDANGICDDVDECVGTLDAAASATVPAGSVRLCQHPG